MAVRRVLVTGVGGFLASALVPLLRRRLPGARLTLASRRARPGAVGADLADPAAASRLVARARPELVFHLAGGHPAADAFTMWYEHVAATVGLCDALRDCAPGARLVLAGSSAEYGRVDGRPVLEAAPPAPMTPYGRVKHDQTAAALSYAADGLDVRVARLFNVCGPGTPESLAPGAFAAQIAALERSGGGTIRVGDLSAGRDFVDVRDAARALLLLGLTPGLSGCYNVCSGRATRMSDALAALIRAARARPRVERDPARLRRNEVSSIRGSHAKLTRATGWTPRIPLVRSLADTLRWHRSR